MSYSNTTSSSSSKITATNGVVVGGKTARACDSCVKKRARWYCAADDAFLCQSCDSSVHSANSLARRHHRLRLKTSSASSPTPSTPTWHRGFTRKARTPRNTPNPCKHVPPKPNARDLYSPSFPIVPEITAATAATNDDEQLLYRVPIFDPLVAELYNNNNNINSNDNNNSNDRSSDQQYCSSPPKVAAVSPSSTAENSGSLQGGVFLPSEMDLAEFAADVESLLGPGLENECDFGIKGLGFVDCEDNRELSSGGIVKIELDDDDNKAMNVDMKICWAETSMEHFEVNFEDYEESPTSCGEEDVDIDKKVAVLSKVEAEEDVKKCHKSSNNNNKKKKKILLRLDYESVITAWASQGSPWTTGARPDFDPDGTWPDCMGSYSDQFHHNHRYMDVSGIGGTSTILADGGREARVSRYREKRRTRLFSKKIRYEVRKLNAEKRPRMKGRFVKRVSFSGPSFPMLN